MNITPDVLILPGDETLASPQRSFSYPKGPEVDLATGAVDWITNDCWKEGNFETHWLTRRMLVHSAMPKVRRKLCKLARQFPSIRYSNWLANSMCLCALQAYH